MSVLVKRVLTGAGRGTIRAHVRTLLEVMSWRVVVALALTLCLSATQGLQLLLLVPLMQLVGLEVDRGSVGAIADFVASGFALVGVRPTLGIVLAVFLLVTCVVAGTASLQTTWNFKLEQGFVAALRQRLYRAIVNADWLTLSKIRSSDLTHALTTELDRVGAATAFLLQVISSGVLVLVYVVFALRLSAVTTVLVFCAGLLLLVLLRGRTRVARLTGEDISLATNGLYSAAIEHLGGVKTTKSYGVEDRSATMFSGLAEKVARVQLAGVRNYAQTAFWFQVGSAVVLSVMLYAAFSVLELPAAALLLLLFLFNRMIPLFNNVQQGLQQYVNALPAFSGVTTLQERCEAAAEVGAAGAAPLELRDAVTLDGVSFSYGETTPAVEGLGLRIPAGETTAIVGPSGAGKSTVADLVTGLVVPDAGRVLVDGAPLNAGRARSWRNVIGYVAQDTFLFNDTVRANLLWANPDANDEDVSRALELSAAREFVRLLPDGLETVLGDRGVRLSGGERQRLALARALLRRPALLILDEATSALDSENERRIQGAIEGLHGRTTILIITHRLSTVRDADSIHVLEGGQLIEAGTWDDLLARRGRFLALARAQGIGKA